MDLDIQIPYTTNPRMVKNTGSIYNINPNKSYIDEKHRQLLKYGNDLYAQTDVCNVLKLVQRGCKHLSIPESDNVQSMALMFEEDLAIIHKGRLEAICFCFPSSWIPSNRIGLKLSDIHRPVADSQKLVSASDRIAKTISDPVLGSFKRSVWTITNNPGLSNHPNEKNDVVPKGINDLYLRTEIQTTCPLPDGDTALFFVKVNVIELSKVWHELGIKLRDSVNSMNDSILTYKNLQHIKPILNNILLM